MSSPEMSSRLGFALVVLMAVITLPTYAVYTWLNDDRGSRAAQVGGAPDPAGSGPLPPGSPPPSRPSSSSPPPTTTPAGFTTRSLTAKSVDQMGDVVVDSEGWTAYRFDLDSPGSPTSACTDAKCLTSWSPVLTNGKPALNGIDPGKVAVIVRGDGGRQVTLAGWPLYRFVGDRGPGRWKGQAVQNMWWVVQPNGKRNLNCLPPGAVPPDS